MFQGPIRNHNYQTMSCYHVLRTNKKINIIRQYMDIMLQGPIRNHHYHNMYAYHDIGINKKSPLSGNIWLSCSRDQSVITIIRLQIIVTFQGQSVIDIIGLYIWLSCSMDHSEINIIRLCLVIMFQEPIGNNHYQTTYDCVLWTNRLSQLSDYTIIMFYVSI